MCGVVQVACQVFLIREACVSVLEALQTVSKSLLLFMKTFNQYLFCMWLDCDFWGFLKGTVAEFSTQEV